MSFFATEYAQTFGRSRLLLGQLGDSRLAAGTSLGGGQDLLRYMHAIGSQIAVRCNGKVRAPLTYNRAVGGSVVMSYVGNGIIDFKGIAPADGSPGQLDELLALSPLPSHALILDGRNGIYLAHFTTAQLIAGYKGIWGRLLQADIIPVQYLDLPSAWVNAADRRRHFDLNTQLRSIAAEWGVVILDATAIMADPANANGDPFAALYSDSPALHPNNAGAYAAATPAVNYFNSIVQAAGFHGWSQGDVYNATDTISGNLVPGGGIFAANGGTLSGANLSGDIAAGMTLALNSGSVTSCVCSLEARTDGGSGNWQKFVITTSGASQMTFYPTTNISAVAGEIIDFGVDIDASGLTNVSQIYARLTDYNVNSTLATYGAMVFDSTKGALPAAIAGRAEADPMTLLTNTTRVLPNVEMRTNGAAVATIKIGAMSARRKQP
jgi:hypothetical protein